MKNLILSLVMILALSSCSTPDVVESTPETPVIIRTGPSEIEVPPKPIDSTKRTYARYKITSTTTGASESELRYSVWIGPTSNPHLLSNKRDNDLIYDVTGSSFVSNRQQLIYIIECDKPIISKLYINGVMYYMNNGNIATKRVVLFFSFNI